MKGTGIGKCDFTFIYVLQTTHERMHESPDFLFVNIFILVENSNASKATVTEKEQKKKKSKSTLIGTIFDLGTHF